MPQQGSPVSISTKLLATGVAVTLAVVVCASAATVMVASGVAKRPNTPAEKPDLSRLANETLRDLGATQALIDTLVAPLGALPVANPRDVQLITGLTAVRGTPDEVWDAAPKAEFPTPLPTRSPRTLPIRFALDSLDEDRIRQFASDTLTEWLPVFRRFARSAPLPSLWGYRAGLPGARTVHELPMRGFQGMRTIFLANEAASILALNNGQPRIALERAQENLSASRHLLEQPLLIDALVGRLFARRSAQLIALSAKALNDEPTAVAAQRLDALAAISRETSPIGRWLSQEEANPVSDAAESVAGNRSLHPSLRMSALASIVFGGCRRTPELVFGFSEKRRIALEHALKSIGDIDRGQELGALYLKWFDALENAPSTPVRLASLGAIDWIVPPGVRSRVAMCAMAVRN